jgi:hypothetical protein
MSAAVIDCYILSSHNLLTATLSATREHKQVLSAVHQTVSPDSSCCSNCYIPVPTAVIAQVSIMRNTLLFITVSFLPTCPATQSAQKELIDTSSDFCSLVRAAVAVRSVAQLQDAPRHFSIITEISSEKLFHFLFRRLKVLSWFVKGCSLLVKGCIFPQN